MSKKILFLKFVLVSVMSFVWTNTTAEKTVDFEVDGLRYDIYEGISVMDGSEYVDVYVRPVDENIKGSVVIPSTVTYDDKTYVVNNIGRGAFSGCTGLTNITIPSAVTYIYDRAFSGCTGLTNIVIPEGVTYIGGGAFADCTGLIGVTIPETIRSVGHYYDAMDDRVVFVFNNCINLTDVVFSGKPTKIVDYLFAGCESLTNITIPNSVTEIGSNAFYKCTGLTNVVIPNSVTVIGEDAFYGCAGLANVVIPNSVTVIGEDAFAYTGLSSVTIPNSVIYLSGFSGTKITSIDIPESVTEIGSHAFTHCKEPVNLTIPNGVTKIGSAAFLGCTGLISATIPNSVTEIGSAAFLGCTGLISATIPNSVTEIGRETFCYCDNLFDIYINSEVPPVCEGDLFNDDKTNRNRFEINVYVPAGYEMWYKTSETWRGCNIIGYSFDKTVYYPINVSEATSSNGNVKIDVSEAEPGSEISITVEPDAGYVVDKVTVNGEVIGITDNKGSFIMPKEEVTISTTFKKDNDAVSLILVDDELVATEYYSVFGQKLSSPANGINVMKNTYKSGRVIYSKCLFQEP